MSALEVAAQRWGYASTADRMTDDERQSHHEFALIVGPSPIHKPRGILDPAGGFYVPPVGGNWSGAGSSGFSVNSPFHFRLPDPDDEPPEAS